MLNYTKLASKLPTNRKVTLTKNERSDHPLLLAPPPSRPGNSPRSKPPMACTNCNDRRTVGRIPCTRSDERRISFGVPVGRPPLSRRRALVNRASGLGPPGVDRLGAAGGRWLLDSPTWRARGHWPWAEEIRHRDRSGGPRENEPPQVTRNLVTILTASQC